MSVLKNWRLIRILAATVVWSCAADGLAEAQTDYTYTVIADLTNCFNIGSPAINNNGDVSFGASCGAPIGPVGGGIVVRRGNGGGSLADIFTFRYNIDSIVPNTDVLSINDSGVVAFGVNNDCSFDGAILTGDGGIPSTVVDVCTDSRYTAVARPSINNIGEVAFVTDTDGTSGYDSVIRVTNGTHLTIAGPGTSTTTVGTLTAAIEPAINNNGVVTFTGQGAAAFGIFTGAGGDLATISLDNPSTFNGINDEGRVAFVGANNSAIQTGAGGPVTTVATVTSSGFQSVNVGGGASINNTGSVAFLAVTQSGAVGVFTGPDPEADVVLKTGEPSPGLPAFGTVTGISILREATNDAGQVAMAVVFDDNGVRKAAIIRADPSNRAPVASDGTASVTAGQSVAGTLSASDPDGDSLTYAIVANGSQGTAVVTDASIGAFTYTAGAGATGGDTFTFQVTDSRGLTSNVATVAVEIQSPPACALNVTASVDVTAGNLHLDRQTGRYTQRVTVRNISGAAITGPVSFVLDSLTDGATLINSTGVTSCATTSGSPYMNIDIGSDSILSPRERANGRLEFTLEFVNPGAVTYTPRILAGPGSR